MWIHTIYGLLCVGVWGVGACVWCMCDVCGVWSKCSVCGVGVCLV